MIVYLTPGPANISGMEFGLKSEQSNSVSGPRMKCTRPDM